MKKTLLLLLLLASGVSSADIGYTFEGDLNGDGIQDKIVSGPHGQFGNGGGPFMISLSSSNGEANYKVVFLHPLAVAIEKHPNGNFLWGYSRHGGATGSLFKISLDGQFKIDEITINGGVSSSELVKSLLASIFNEKFLITFTKIDAYTPPDYPWGKG